MQHDILISPGFGAGWSTWMHDREQSRFALTYQPLIDALKGQGDFDAALAQFERDFEQHFDDAPYTGGAFDLRVITVDGPFIIDEYDGSESVQYRDETDWIDFDSEER